MSFLGLNAFDGLMILVLVAFTITGALRGFALEVMSLMLWPLSAFISWLFADRAAPMFESIIGEPQLRLVAAFVAVFLAVFLLGTVVVFFIHRILPLRGPLRTPNVVLGGLAGLLRGAIIIIIVFLVAGITPMPKLEWWRESLLTPYFQKAAVAVSSYLPRDIATQLRYS
jgi:membrane protein required for colicin V production